MNSVVLKEKECACCHKTRPIRSFRTPKRHRNPVTHDVITAHYEGDTCHYCRKRKLLAMPPGVLRAKVEAGTANAVEVDAELKARAKRISRQSRAFQFARWGALREAERRAMPFFLEYKRTLRALESLRADPEALHVDGKLAVMRFFDWYLRELRRFVFRKEMPNPDALRTLQHDEIGRASCRERV